MTVSRVSPATIPVHLGSTSARDYDVLVGAGLLGCSGSLIPNRCPAHRYALITDDVVDELYARAVQRSLESAGARVDIFAFASGEQHKTRDTWAAISDAMIEAGLGRDAAVIALGGGVVGDLAGFVAATYMRGRPVVQIPTTLLAMIDASVGGKTGVDSTAGKNLIGAFHQPRLVIADPLVLRSLPAEHIRGGLAEAIKHGAIADAAYFDWMIESEGSVVSGDPDVLSDLIVRSVQIKADVVHRDEHEAGPRRALNFGHTIGHAIEAASGYRRSHGECVSIGMVVEARIGEAIGVSAPGTAQRLQAALETFGLPVAVPPGEPADELVARTRADKKAREGRVEYSLIERIGVSATGRDGGWGYPVEDRVVRQCLSGAGGLPATGGAV